LFPNSEIIASQFNISNGDFLANFPEVELLQYRAQSSI